MRSKLESKISVTFFLKKISLKSEVKKKAVYATIAFKGTSAKISTGIKCEDPEKDWKAGMFEGKNFTDEIHKLLSIRKEIESYDSRFFKSADHAKAVFNGAEDSDLPMTILEVLDEKYEEKKSEVEITVSWFSILNSFFIILFASFFSKWWESKYNPSAATKYALGLIIMSFGFGFLAFGSMGIVEGVKVSMIWLILAYLFHTLGELCLSPVGLSYVSKLVPPRMIALMFGMYYLAVAIGNKSAAVLGGQIENITEHYSLSTFFLIFTIVPLIAGLFVYTLNPLLKKLMHGVN